ncbi:hypothetical protein CFOL_v3_34081 [Cephalotus follicularis]|uniref:Gag-asp_proteas domain-containing protein n=1 Tax=Cephalotus follicularis TaxID=3775 RepID=A0A1Q3DE16_CEPFO|nr:hypothetical protein CFOL_v3_34081 [Cephalotus follicularis]
MRCDVPEHPEQKIARFLRGLNHEITNIVELQPYCTFEDVCKLAIKVEKQNKGTKSLATRTYSQPAGSKPFTLGKSFSKGFSSSKPKALTQDKLNAKSIDFAKERADLSKGDKRYFKCHGYGHFQAECPNKRVKSIKDIEEIKDGPKEKEQEEKDSLDEENIIADPEDGELLVIRHALHVKEVGDDDQRENIFHSRCIIKERVCSLIIDGGSCSNVAATTLVDKFKLPTTAHPSP